MKYTTLILRAIPIGGIVPSSYDFGSSDENFIECSGYELSKTGYPHLFNVLGAQFGQTNGSGGAGTTHFRIPDCRGVFLYHTPDSVSLPPGTHLDDVLGTHTHDLYNNANDAPSSTLSIYRDDYDVGYLGSWSTSNSGGSETRPDNIYVKYYIRYI